MNHNIRNALLAAAAAVAFAGAPAAAQDVAQKSDGEWMTLSGTVEAVAGETFVLDYGKNSLTVEMDDYDWYNENVLALGDEVTVTGRIDDDFLQSRRLEASSVYVDSLHTRFYANAADEEDFTPAVMIGDTSITLSGTVQAIGGDEMIVDGGVFDYKVDTGALLYDPFDATGFQHIAVGDRVSVSGQFDDSDFYDSPEIDAQALIEIST